MKISYDRQLDSGFHSRWFDNLLDGGRGIIAVGDKSPRTPFITQGQSSSINLGLEEFFKFFFPWITSLDGKERRWFCLTVSRFVRDYLRSLSLCFPRLKFTMRQLDITFGGMIGLHEVIPTLKGACLCPMSRLLSGSHPWILPLKGGPRRYLQKVLTQQPNARKMCFSNTILQLKRIADVVPQSFVIEQLEKHAKLVTQKRRQSFWFIDTISKETNRITSKFNYEYKPNNSVYDRSFASCVESTRQQGGVYGYFIRLAFKHPEEFPVVRCWDVADNKVTTYRSPLAPSEGQLENQVWSDLKNGPLPRNVIAICEPLKVRVITTHTACESPLWSRFQKELSLYLSRRKEILSGKVVNQESFSSIPIVRREMAKHYGVPLDDILIISDDASAATDSISTALTLSVASDFLPDELIDLFELTLKGRLYYKKLDREVDQVNGQMMGDRRSFPLLCLIHLGAKKAFLRLFGVPLHLQFIRINGDDGLTILPRSLVDAYFNFMKELWDLNMLKSYVHPEYFSFNSTFFSQNGEKVGIIRWNLLEGVDKFGSAGINPDVWNCVREDAPSEYEEQLWKHFCSSKHWRKTLSFLDKRGGGGNWNLPRCVGGYGLRRTSGPNKITMRQSFAIKKVIDCIGTESLPKGIPTKVSAVKSFHIKTQTYSFLRNYASFGGPKVSDDNPRKAKTPNTGTRLLAGRLPVKFLKFIPHYLPLWEIMRIQGLPSFLDTVIA